MSPLARVLALPVRCYRWGISPLLAPHCRFTPTCSSYALQALADHGALRGTWLAVRRVARCHPFTPGGVDPVPPRAGRAVGETGAADRTTAATRPAPPAPIPGALS